MFHFGSLLVIMGHVMACSFRIPGPERSAWRHLYHQALLLGAPAGFSPLCSVSGLLIYRRRIRAPVADPRNDKLMYLVLVCAIVAGWHAR